MLKEEKQLDEEIESLVQELDEALANLDNESADSISEDVAELEAIAKQLYENDEYSDVDAVDESEYIDIEALEEQITALELADVDEAIEEIEQAIAEACKDDDEEEVEEDGLDDTEEDDIDVRVASGEELKKEEVSPETKKKQAEYLANRKKVRDAAIAKQKEGGAEAKGGPKAESDDDMDDDEVAESTNSDIQRLIESEDGLSESFKANAALIFETEIALAEDKIAAELNEQYEQKLEEAVRTYEKTLEEQVNEYLEYVVTEWVASNSVELETSLRNDIQEDIVNAIHSAFSENYVPVPTKDVNVVKELKAQLAEQQEDMNRLQEQLNEAMAESNMACAQRIIAESKSGLSSVQAEKLEKLASKLEFVNEDDFSQKLETLKDFYFKGAEEVNESFDDEVIVLEHTEIEEGVEIDEQSPISETVKGEPVDDRMNRYLRALSSVTGR